MRRGGQGGLEGLKGRCPGERAAAQAARRGRRGAYLDSERDGGSASRRDVRKHGRGGRHGQRLLCRHRAGRLNHLRALLRQRSLQQPPRAGGSGAFGGCNEHNGNACAPGQRSESPSSLPQRSTQVRTAHFFATSSSAARAAQQRAHSRIARNQNALTRRWVSPESNLAVASAFRARTTTMFN